MARPLCLYLKAWVSILFLGRLNVLIVNGLDLTCANNAECASQSISSYDNVYCTGATGCSQSQIMSISSYLECSGYQSCLESVIQVNTNNFVINAIGAYSLQNGTITITTDGGSSETAANVDIELYGYYAGLGLNIECNGTNLVCNIVCLGNGCAGSKIVSSNSISTAMINVDCDISNNIDCPDGYYGPTSNPTSNPTSMPSMNSATAPCNSEATISTNDEKNEDNEESLVMLAVLSVIVMFSVGINCWQKVKYEDLKTEQEKQEKVIRLSRVESESITGKNVKKEKTVPKEPKASSNDSDIDGNESGSEAPKAKNGALDVIINGDISQLANGAGGNSGDATEAAPEDTSKESNL